jgi:hypothetical protein
MAIVTLGNLIRSETPNPTKAEQAVSLANLQVMADLGNIFAAA